jgi:hypothetical protein
MLEEVRRRLGGDPRSFRGATRALLKALLNWIDEQGGPLNVASLGASLFRQAVLLFRSSEFGTSRADFKKSGTCSDDSDGSTKEALQHDLWVPKYATTHRSTRLRLPDFPGRDDLFE